MLLRKAAELAQLRTEVAQLRETVEELARRLGRTSRHSSQPSSDDPPQPLSQRVQREPSGRGAAGQPGHEGKTRPLGLVAEVNVVLLLMPVWWAHSRHALLGGDPYPIGIR